LKTRSMHNKVFKFAGFVILFILGIVGNGYINIKYNIGFPCAVNKVFGIYCPGCGLTRAGVAMLQLEFYQAFRYNAFSLILIPLIFIVVIGFIWEYVFDKSSFIAKVPAAFWIVLFSCVFIYGIVRNFIQDLQPMQI